MVFSKVLDISTLSNSKIKMKTIVYVIVLSLLWACNRQTSQDSSHSDPQELMELDLQFAQVASEIGISQAFYQYADPKAIVLSQGSFPLKGPDEIREDWQKVENSLKHPPQLSWKPTKAEIAQSGDLGYTFGTYEFTELDSLDNPSISYGNYVTVWKKQEDGSWKYVLDGGASTPSPEDQ